MISGSSTFSDVQVFTAIAEKLICSCEGKSPKDLEINLVGVEVRKEVIEGGDVLLQLLVHLLEQVVMKLPSFSVPRHQDLAFHLDVPHTENITAWNQDYDVMFSSLRQNNACVFQRYWKVFKCFHSS